MNENRIAPAPAPAPGRPDDTHRPRRRLLTRLFGALLHPRGRSSGSSNDLWHERTGDDPRLARARAALSEARLQMPGLLGEPSGDGANEAIEASPAASETAIPEGTTGAPEPASALGRVGRVEDALGTLDEECRRLGSEVATLRLVVKELREALMRFDERGVEPAEVKNARLPALQTVPLTDPKAKPSAGPTELEVRVLSVDDPTVLEYLRRGLATVPALDDVQVIRCSDGEATLRCSLTRRQPEGELLDAIQSAIPSAKPLTGAGQGRLLLRMRPV